MIQIKQGKMADSTAHVFVYILTESGALLGNPPAGLYEKANEITASIAARKRPGRLWIHPVKQNWPQTLSPTPNGQPSRTVWCAIIPQQEGAYSHEIETSLFLLSSWIKATNLPLRIAAYNDGCYCKSGDMLMTSKEYERQLGFYLREWDVEVYHP